MKGENWRSERDKQLFAGNGVHSLMFGILVLVCRGLSCLCTFGFVYRQQEKQIGVSNKHLLKLLFWLSRNMEGVTTQIIGPKETKNLARHVTLQNERCVTGRLFAGALSRNSATWPSWVSQLE